MRHLDYDNFHVSRSLLRTWKTTTPASRSRAIKAISETWQSPVAIKHRQRHSDPKSGAILSEKLPSQIRQTINKNYIWSENFETLSIILILCILNIVTYFSIVASVFGILTGTSWILKNAFIRAAKSFAQWHDLSKSQSNSLQCSLTTICGTQNFQNKLCF